MRNPYGYNLRFCKKEPPRLQIKYMELVYKCKYCYNKKMICRKCNGCGLCSGDGRFSSPYKPFVEKIHDINFSGDPACSSADAGIAVDIGTTTIAAAAFSLKTGKLIYECGEKNAQYVYGPDIVARINAAEKNYDEVRSLLINQLKAIFRKIVENVSLYFLSKRSGRMILKRVVFTGNTTMLSFVAGMKVSALGRFPFRVPSEFDMEMSLGEIFGSEEFGSACTVYFPPVISAFIGADAVCAMTSSFSEDGGIQYMADTGTNCEMAVYDGTEKKLYCTSSSAGPAFEGTGISCGIVCSEGAVVKLSPNGNSFDCTVAGGGNGKGICGTGLISALCVLYECGKIDFHGTICDGGEIKISEGISLLQEDIRRLQLAKAAVYSGLAFLNSKVRNRVSGTLYLCGGFGNHIDVSEAVRIGMIPQFLSGSVIHKGNAALSGAAAMLFDEKMREKGRYFAEKAEVINLALEEDFQNRFIASIDFPH